MATKTRDVLIMCDNSKEKKERRIQGISYLHAHYKRIIIKLSAILMANVIGYILKVQLSWFFAAIKT